MTKSLLPLILAIALAPLAVSAKELFTVTTTGAANLTVSGSKLPDLLEDAIKADGAFAGLGNNSATIALDYAGMANAIVVNIVAPTVPGGNFTATLQLPGFTKTFTATTKDGLQTEIENFVEEDEAGRKEVLKSLKKIYAGTPITITDGTPHSSTAMLANRAFDEFGLRHARTNGERTALNEGKELDSGWIGLEVDAGQFETAGGYKGTSYTVAPTLRLGDRWGFVLSMPVRYLDIEGSQSAEAGVLAGIPLQLISESKDSHLFWQVTPHVHAAAAASVDILQAGVEVGGGVTNRLGYNFGFCTVQMANQLGFYQGLDVSGYDTGVKQEIVKNGLSVSIPVAGGWLVETRAVRTDFLKDAAVPEYYTFGADLVYRSPCRVSWALFFVPDDFYVGAYYDTDFKDYSSPHARTGIRWKW
jgi:hypothetical protein